MLSSTSLPQPKQIPFAAMLGVGFIAQVLSIIPLWSHQSLSAVVGGRYSPRYAVALAANIALLAVWAVLFIERDKVIVWLRKLTFFQSMRVIVFTGLIVTVMWLLPLDATVKQYVSLNWLLVTGCLLLTMPDRETKRGWGWVGWVAVALLFVPVLITVLTQSPISPDESQWADFASSPFEATGLYSRTTLQEPTTIAPGFGWGLAGYGWALENVAFDIKVGRLWNFYFYLLAFAGIGAVTWRLYGRRAAAFSVIFAALSMAFIVPLQYAPVNQLPAAAMLITFSALQARLGRYFAPFWHFVCGLAALLSLQLHPAAIAFVFGFILFYSVEFVVSSVQQRHIAKVTPLSGFGVGALIGGAIFYQVNILPAGGLTPYLQLLNQWQGSLARVFQLLTWPSLFEAGSIGAALAYIAWRRSPEDRLFLGILVCVVIGIMLFVAPEYLAAFDAFYIVPVGVIVTVVLPDVQLRDGKSLRALVVGLSLIALLTLQRIDQFIAWPTIGQVIQTGELPSFLYEDLKPQLLPLLKPNDIVASTGQLIWTLPHQQVISVSAEAAAMKRWNLTDPVDVWERVQPTAVVDVDAQMAFGPGLIAYIDRHHFVVCKILTVLGTSVTVFRQTCLPASP